MNQHPSALIACTLHLFEAKALQQLSVTRVPQGLFFSYSEAKLGGLQSDVSMSILMHSWRQLNLSWKCSIDLYLNFIFEYEKKSPDGERVTDNRCSTFNREFLVPEYFLEYMLTVHVT